LHSGWTSSGGLFLKVDILELHDVAVVIDWNTTSSLPTAMAAPSEMAPEKLSTPEFGGSFGETSCMEIRERI